MLGRNPRLQRFPGDVAFARGQDVFGDQHVDAIGLAVDVIVDPFQFLLDALGRMRGGAQDTEAAGAADGGDNVATMAEGEQRKLDAQHIANRRFHGFNSLRQASCGDRRLAQPRRPSQARFVPARTCVQTLRGKCGSFRPAK